MTSPRYAHGVMTITLNGADLDLTANIRTARTICRLYNGLTDAYAKANVYDFDTVTNILNIASGRTNHQADATAEAVFAHGLEQAAPLAILYLNFLSGGGKPPAGTATATGTDAPAPEGDAPGEAA